MHIASYMRSMVPVSDLLCMLSNAAAAAGNVATEDVVYLLNGLGIKHGVDMEKLLDVSQFISDALGRPNSSRAAKALLAARTEGQKPQR